MAHGPNQDPDHASAKLNETTYRVWWVGFGPNDDSYEPIQHLPRNMVVSYYKRKGLPLPKDIDKAEAG